MRDFKVNKFLVMMNSLQVRTARQHKLQTFSLLQNHMITLNVKFKKLRSHAHFANKL